MRLDWGSPSSRMRGAPAGASVLRRHRLALLSSLPVLAIAPWSSPAYALCTSAGSSATVCVVTDRNEGPGTAANPTLRYAIEEANNSGGTTAVRVDPNPTPATISGASFVLGNVQFEGSGAIKIDAPFVLSSPKTFSVGEPYVNFGSSSATGSTLTFHRDFTVQTSLSVQYSTAITSILNVANGGQAHFGILTLSSGGTVVLGTGATLSVGFDCGLGGGGFGCGSNTINGTINGTGNFVKDGDSRTRLSGVNTFTGSVTVNDGLLQIGSANVIPAVAPLILNGGILVPYTQGTTVQSMAINGNATILGFGGGVGYALTFGTGTLNAQLTLADATLNGDLSGSGGIDLKYVFTYSGLNISGGGPDEGFNNTNSTLNGQNTYTGATTVYQGMLTAGVAGAFSPNSTFTVASGATLNLNNFNQTIGSLAGAGSVTLGTARLTTGGDNSSTTFDGVIAGTGGSLVKAGTGNMTLAGANTYTGGTTLNAGTLTVNNNSALGTGTLVMNAGTLQTTAVGGTTLANNVTVNGGGIGGSQNMTLNGGVTLNSTLTNTNTATTTLNGVVSGNGGITQDSSGTLLLTGNNTYNGGTTVNAGKVTANNNSALGGGTLLLNGGTLQTTVGGTTLANAVTIGAGNGAIGGGSNLTLNGNVALTGNLTSSSTATTTLGGIVSGNGGISHTGSGTLTLTGANTYNGGTTVGAGTLSLTGTGSIASSSGVDITASGANFDISGTAAGATIKSLSGVAGALVTMGAQTLTLSNASGSFAGAIGGSGGLTLTAGTQVLTGTNTYTGATTVNGGTLIVNGSIATSSALNINGGFVGGTAALPSLTIGSGGTLSPGNSIGVVNINGNLILGAGAIYIVEVSPTDADRTNVSGTAQLGGELRLIFGPGSYASRNYTILSANGGRSGTFNTVTTQNLPATLSADVQYTSTDVTLVTLASQIAKTLTGTTPNQKALAAAQDAAFNGGQPSILALYNLSLAQLPNALDKLSGEVHASTTSMLADEAGYARNAILGRLRQASYGGTMGAMASLTIGGPQAFAGGEDMTSALAYAKSPIVRQAPNAPAAERDVVFWAQGFGAWGKFDGDGNAASARRDLAGFFTGLDTRAGDAGRIGIAAGYTGSKNNTDGRGSSNVDTAHVAAYGGWSLGALNLRAGGAFAAHSINTDRTINFPGFFDRTFASYDGHTGQVFGELGYGFALANIALEPFAGAAWVRVRTDGATERGGAAALNVAATTFETGTTTLGVRAASMIPVGDNMILIPRASLAWQHAFGDTTPATTFAFAAAPASPFTVSGVPIARDALLAEAALDLAIGSNMTAGVSYTGQIARHVADHGAKGKFSYRF